MILESKRVVVGVLSLLFLGALVAVSIVDARRKGAEEGHKPPVVPADSKACVECHTKITRLAVQQWSESKHGEQGISCMACHAAKGSEGFAHHEARITSVVTPKTCATCHKDEADQFARSPHGAPQAGLEIKLKDGKPDPKTWPAPLVGRINPDGTAGSCNACHGRHRFELADARSPDTCASCHLADGSADAWRRSAHAAGFLGAAAGETPKGPSCVTCHMQGKPGAKALHDVAARVSWSLKESKRVQREGADARRDAMMETCTQCHGNGFVEASFQRIDAAFTATFVEAAPATPAYLLKPAAWPHLSPQDHRALMQLAAQAAPKK